LSKKQLHEFDDGIPLFSETFDTPEAAIIGGQRTDSNRKKELGLYIDSIRGLPVRTFRWSPNRLALTFDKESLVLENKPAEIQVFVSNNLIPTQFTDQTIYEIVYSSGSIATWNPILIATKFVGKKFMNIQLTHRIVWLYFHKSPTLIEVIQCPVREFSLPILHWEEGT
jgi:hypothetical protein